MVMTRSGYVYEIEIKTSKSDLVRDLKKQHGHSSSKIRKLYFCIPESLMEFQGLIPEHAGIIVCDGNFCVKKREAKANRVPPLDAEAREKLYQLAAMRVWTLKRKFRDTLRNNKESTNENQTGF